MRTFTAIVLGLAASAIQPAVGQVIREIPRETPDVRAIDETVRPVLDALKSGNTKGAVDTFVANSPLMAGKTTELANLQSQFQNAITLYGPISSFDLSQEERYGQSVVRRYYVASQSALVTRWEFVLARTNKGWIIAYLGFDDQVRSWLK